VVRELDQSEGTAFAALFAALPARAQDGDAAIAEVWELATALEQQLRDLGEPVGGEPTGPDMDQVLKEFEPLLQAIATVANGDDAPRATVEEALPRLEEQGWQISAAVQAVWAGERDLEALSAGLDDSDTQLLRRILDLIA